MGVSFSCSAGNLDDLDGGLESLLVRSVSSGNIDGNTEHDIVKSFGSGKMIVEGSLSFRGRDLETMISFRTPSDVEGNVIVMPATAKQMSRETHAQFPTPDSLYEKQLQIPPLEPGIQRSQAALKLQKVYKSFRTRRQLADCAVLVEQRWWKLLDFAELRRSSVSFFDIERPETAVSCWSRARTRVAKVGKGLLKDEKARKLALQHWLEAIDPRHRYGHNLQFYYAKWLHCESKQPFFYWLDIGDGKEVSLDRCLRPKLQQQCIKYLGPTERQAYEVIVKDGTFFHKQTWELLDTRRGPKDTKWIFVLSTSKTLYVGQKTKGTFQHSSFLAGGATLSAGRLVVEDGILKAVWPHSGHYLPTEENFEEFMLFLMEHNVDLSIVQKSPTDEEEEAHSKKMSSIVSAPDFTQVAEETNIKSSTEEKIESSKQDCSDAKMLHLHLSNCPRESNSEIARLELANREDVPAIFKKEEQQQGSNCTICYQDSISDGYATAEEVLSDDEFMVSKQNLYDEDQEAEFEDAIPKDKIVQRINSHKELKSYQLAHQLSCKWTTGAGPRIGCMRDYPSELQFWALEEANLSPRSTFSSPRGSGRLSPKILTPKNSCRDTVASRSPLYSKQVGTP